MLTNATFLEGLVIHAIDGELGTVDQFFFDDETWAIRYLTVKTGGWLSGREVLISPISIAHTDWPARKLDVTLTKKQVENSPDIDTHKPVSRQHETDYFRYYGYSSYWGGPYMWGPAYYPAALAVPNNQAGEATLRSTGKPDSHLRSSAAVNWRGDRSCRRVRYRRSNLGNSLHGSGDPELVAREESPGVARMD